MIAFLDGELLEKNVGRVVLNVGGVGYELAVPTSVLARLPAVGERARLHTRMVVREDSMTLYGFASTDERELFDLLTGVTGVGPKVGLAFLSALQPDALRRAVVAGDADTLTVVPGVGKKVAQRVVLDLRDKLGGEGADVISIGPAGRRARGAARAGAHVDRGRAGHGRDRCRGQGARRPPSRGPAEGGTMTVMPRNRRAQRPLRRAPDRGRPR